MFNEVTPLPITHLVLLDQAQGHAGVPAGLGIVHLGQGQAGHGGPLTSDGVHGQGAQEVVRPRRGVLGKDLYSI